MRSLMIIVVLLFAGCSTVTGNRTFEGKYDRVHKYSSNIQDVAALLGAPTQVVHQEGAFTMLIYEKRKIYTANWITNQMKVDIKRLSITFDENNVVTDLKMESMTNDYH